MSILSGNPIVARALAALSAFGGDLDRVQAERLLRMWAHFAELSPREVDAILYRFPASVDGQ